MAGFKLRFGDQNNREMGLGRAIFLAGLAGVSIFVGIKMGRSDSDSDFMAVLGPLIFCLVGIIGTFLVWRKYLRQHSGRQQSISSEAPNRAWRILGGVGVMGFFGIFFVVGAPWFYWMFVGPALNVIGADDWVETPCVIRQARIKTHNDGDDTEYSLQVRYRYEYEGETYHSNRYWFLTEPTDSYTERRAIVDSLPEGKRTTCYVNPDSPSEAVIDRNWPSDIWLGLAPLIFVFIGLGGMIGAGVYTFRRSRRMATADSWLPSAVDAGATAGTATTDGAASASTHDEPTTLRSTGSRIGKFIGTICFAAIWNGITSIFVIFAVNSHINGDPEWFLTIFMIPFVLVGLGAIGAIGYNALALLNPVVELRVNNTQLPIGQTIHVNWRINGNAARIAKLTISLEGEEKATYQRGTDSVTERAKLAIYHLTEVTDAQTIQSREGECELQIPLDAMHTFQAENNEIHWKLTVFGEIQRWPDVKDDHEFMILPAPIQQSAPT